MKIDYLFSRKDKWGSKLIVWASTYENLELEEIPSHIAVLLNGDIVVESTLCNGVRMLPYSKWKQINEELYRIPCEHDRRPSKEVLGLAFSFWGKGYDWKGLLFFSLCMLRLIAFKSPRPKVNLWQRPDKYFCTEFVAQLVNRDFSMHSPARICEEWLKECP